MVTVGLAIFDFVNSLIIKLFEKCNLTAVFESRYGIKNFNLHYGYFSIAKAEKEVLINPDELFLDPDFLKDEYTLLDKCILNSPHFELMNLLYNQRNIINSDYFSRLAKGTLDKRNRIHIGKKTQKFISDKFTKMLHQMSNYSYEPVRVYKMNNKIYIFDGKHRAALSALLNNKVKCVFIKPLDLSDATVFQQYKLMKKREKFFSKNISFYEHEDCLHGIL